MISTSTYLETRITYGDKFYRNFTPQQYSDHINTSHVTGLTEKRNDIYEGHESHDISHVSHDSHTLYSARLLFNKQFVIRLIPAVVTY